MRNIIPSLDARDRKIKVYLTCHSYMSPCNGWKDTASDSPPQLINQAVIQISFTEFQLCFWKNTRNIQNKILPSKDGETHAEFRKILNAKLL